MTHGPRLPHQPALDGLRGLAVALVLAFHQGFGWMPGGFLGVSVFFTLSGFLITSLLLVEHAGTGSVDVGAFLARRYRRLLPASMAALVLVAAMVATGALTASPSLRGDLLAALAQVANWRFLLAGQSYAELFAAPSPVLHFWSLAIEEQLYLVLPPAIWWLLARRRVGLATLAGGLAAATLASVGTAVWLGLAGQADATYYATPARAAELLVGSLLAVIVHGRRWVLPRWVAPAGLVALVGIVALAATTARTERWLQLGGLAAFAVLSALVVAAAVTPGPVRRLLAPTPLQHLGRISYGVYLYHWPIFLWLTPGRTGVDGWTLFGLRLAVTLAVAETSFRLLERPVRERRVLATPRRAAAALPVAAAATAAILVAVTTLAPAPRPAFARVAAVAAPLPPVEDPAPASPVGRARTVERAPAAGGQAVEEVPPPDARTAVPGAGAPVERPIRLLVAGDSTAFMTAAGLFGWGLETGQLSVSGAAAELGCGIGRGGERVYDVFGAHEIPDRCAWDVRWPVLVAENRPDAVLVQVGPWDVTDRRLAGEKVWRGPGDPVYDEYLAGELLAAIDLLEGFGVRIIWLTSPRIELGRLHSPPPAEPFPANQPARMERLNELIRRAAAQRPEVTLIDLAGYLASLPGGELDGRLRPDGVHFTEQTSREVADWLGPEVVAALRSDPAPANPLPQTLRGTRRM